MKSLIKLNPEQLQYLKSLDSKKKKRKFLLDCLIENIEVENNEIKLDEFLKNCVFKKWEYLVEKPLGEEIKIDTDLKNESESEKIKFVYEHFDHLLEIIKTAEIAEILKTICVKQQDYQYASKFRELEKKFREKEELIAKSNEPQPPMEFCVEITDENRLILERIWCEINKEKQISFLGKYIISNSLLTHFYSCKSHKNLPIVTTGEFLKYIGKEDLIEREVTEQGSELLKFDMLEEKTKTSKLNDAFFEQLNVKKELLISEIKKIVSTFENKEEGISVLYNFDKIGFFIDEDAFNKYHKSAK